MSKQIVYNEAARQALENGIDILVKAVSVTLGPRGKNVVLESKFGIPQIVNDGITIAKEIHLSNQLENTGVSLIRQATSKTNDVVGDGTTTATVLAHAIIKEGLKSIAAGSNPVLIKKGIEKAVYFVIDKISEYSKPVTNLSDIIHIASISAGNDLSIGSIIAEAFQKVGREGIISLEEGHSLSTHLEVTEGMCLDKGFISPYFVSDRTNMLVSQENPLILLTDKKITFVQQELVPILEQVATTGRPLLIIAEDIEKEALATLIINKLRNIVDVVAVRSPGFGDRRKSFLEDIAILTGAQIVSKDLGLSLDNISLNVLGSAKRVIVSRDNTTIISEGNHGIVQLRCSQLRKQINASNNNYEKEKLQERLSKLAGGVAIIKVGAATETEMKEKKLRFEDAVSATRAAIEEGIVPGGGSLLVHLGEQLRCWASKYLLSEELIGANIVIKSLSVPLAMIVQNSGYNGSVIVEKIKNTHLPMGYDANKGKIIDMYIAGIIDPAKVTRSALQNASSIASIILTTECIISDKLVKFRS